MKSKKEGKVCDYKFRKRELFGVVRCTNNECLSCCDRDVNSCNSQRDLTILSVSGKRRPICFRRNQSINSAVKDDSIESVALIMKEWRDFKAHRCDPERREIRHYSTEDALKVT